MTSASLGIRWRFACSWASLLTLRAEANNVVTQPAINAARECWATAAAASGGCFSSQTPRVPLPRRMRIPEQASVNGFLWCAKRSTLQVRLVSAPFLVRRASCSAPGSFAAFWSMWISKLFNYCSFAGAEVRGEKPTLLGSLFSDGQACFASFVSSLCCCECFESWSQTQLWPCFF